ncbi:HipA N-terminal domain-containing protein [Rheinheimera sp. UJ51]|uniref:HipA N-terminal domain-containing protein n=1 Tax=Rheinheimera sp. UJ51 TaxID=2892446 RepID=UPI003B66C15B|nr:HipA N-terminal domain-containing protein [Rheinheimera sp. UJ51]
MDTLDIHMNGIRVGEYLRDRRGENSFTYDTDWLRSPGRRSLSLPLTLRPESYIGPQVYNFFDH